MKTMSEKDLVERGDVLNAFCNHSEVVIHNGKPSFVVNYPNVIRSIPAVPREMSAREYERILRRMEKTQPMPEELYLHGKAVNHYEIDKAIAIVEKWAREHPERSEE